MPTVSVREATADDAELIASFILQLARYEQCEEEAHPNVERLRNDLASDANPRLHCLIAQVDHTAIGFALYFLSYSTFLTCWNIYLEDFFVQEEHRGKGIGTLLFEKLGQIAKEHGSKRLDFVVLKWNKKAIRFYEMHGAQTITEWQTMRFEGEPLQKLGKNF